MQRVQQAQWSGGGSGGGGGMYVIGYVDARTRQVQLPLHGQPPAATAAML